MENNMVNTGPRTRAEIDKEFNAKLEGWEVEVIGPPIKQRSIGYHERFEIFSKKLGRSVLEIHNLPHHKQGEAELTHEAAYRLFEPHPTQQGKFTLLTVDAEGNAEKLPEGEGFYVPVAVEPTRKELEHFEETVKEQLKGHSFLRERFLGQFRQAMSQAFQKLRQTK